MFGCAPSNAFRADAIVMAVCAGSFSLLAAMVVTGGAHEADAFVRAAVHSLVSPLLTALFEGLSFLGSVIVLAVASVAAATALFLSGRKRDSLRLALAMGSVMLLNSALKLLFHLARPEAFFGVLPDSYSFPSGHSAFSCCFFGMLAAIAAAHVRSPKQRITVFVVAALVIAGIGISRIYLGVHYPTDVAGGYLLALFTIAAVDLTTHQRT